MAISNIALSTTTINRLGLNTSKTGKPDGETKRHFVDSNAARPSCSDNRPGGPSILVCSRNHVVPNKLHSRDTAMLSTLFLTRHLSTRSHLVQMLQKELLLLLILLLR